MFFLREFVRWYFNCFPVREGMGAAVGRRRIDKQGVKWCNEVTNREEKTRRLI